MSRQRRIPIWCAVCCSPPPLLMPTFGGEPAAEVEFVEIGPASLSFACRSGATPHLKTAGKLKSDLNFDVWKRLKAEGVAPPTAVIAVTMASSAP